MNAVNVETLRVRSQLSILVFLSYVPLKNSHYVHRNLRSYELSEKKNDDCQQVRTEPSLEIKLLQVQDPRSKVVNKSDETTLVLQNRDEVSSYSLCQAVEDILLRQSQIPVT